jgi:flagellar hook assembly protein FlgD
VVSLRIFDVNGRSVRAWNGEHYDAGEHTLVWDGNDQHGQPVVSGMYFSELVLGTQRQVAKMALVR